MLAGREIARKSLASLDAALDAIDARLSSEFKEYAELANPKPLTIAAAQAFLMTARPWSFSWTCRSPEICLGRP